MGFNKIPDRLNSRGSLFPFPVDEQLAAACRLERKQGKSAAGIRTLMILA